MSANKDYCPNCGSESELDLSNLIISCENCNSQYKIGYIGKLEQEILDNHNPKSYGYWTKRNFEYELAKIWNIAHAKN